MRLQISVLAWPAHGFGGVVAYAVGRGTAVAREVVAEYEQRQAVVPAPPRRRTKARTHSRARASLHKRTGSKR